MSAGANRRGAGFMVAAMAAFSLEDMLFKSAAAQTAPGIAVLQFGATGFVLFAAIALLRRERILPPSLFSRGLMARSTSELAGRLFYALALAWSDLGSTSAILQATPLVVTLGAVALFGETVGWRRWVAIAIGFAGVILVLRPAGDGIGLGSIFALLGMLGFAGRDLATRAARPAITNAQLGTLGFAVIVAAGLILCAALPGPLAMPSPTAMLQLTGAAGFGVAAYAALTAAMRTGEVSVVTPFRYTRLIFALLLGAAVFGEHPTPGMLTGAALIVGSGAFTLYRTSRARAR